MTKPLRRHGIDLEAFNPEEPLLSNPTHYRQVRNTTDDTTFLRALEFSKPRRMGLDELLAWADEEFLAVAQACGGNAVVGHQWGVYSLEHRPDFLDNYPEFRQSLLPDGYLLAARVAVIDPVGPIPLAVREAVQAGTAAYSSTLKPTHPILNDVRPDQFSYGVERPHDADTAPGLIFHDIEPKYQDFPVFNMFDPHGNL